MPLTARVVVKKKAAKPSPAKKRKNSSTPAPAAKRTKTGGQSAKANKDQIKWTSLRHCGVLFPPEYTAHGVKMLYDGQPVELTPDQEEVWPCTRHHMFFCRGAHAGLTVACCDVQ